MEDTDVSKLREDGQRLTIVSRLVLRYEPHLLLAEWGRRIQKRLLDRSRVFKVYL